MVDPEMEATMPRLTTSLAMSGTYRRERGTSRVLGSSQANALTAITTSGGKNRRTSPAGAFLKAVHALLEESLAPHRDDIPPRVQPPGDLVVAETLGRQEHDLGTEDVTIRQRILP